MKVLIFGSRGLVGSSLVRRFSETSIISDVYASSRSDTDLFSYQQTRKTIEEYKPDCIINAAAKVGGILANNSERTDFILDNLKINMNILESLKGFSKIKLINLGSSCIYPLNAKSPIKEDSLMTGGLEPTNSPYAMAKLTAIEIGDALSKEFGHEVINLMPTNLYGPNDNFSDKKSHVIPGLIYRMHKSKNEGSSHLEVWGTGKPLREFLFVDDLSDAVLFILENNINNSLLNIGSGDETTIKELANTVKKVVGYKGDLIFNTDYPDGNPRKLLDSSIINNYGWSSKVSLENGLEITYNWYKNQ